MMLKNWDQASQVERLCGFSGLDKMLVWRRDAGLSLGERDFQARQLLVGLEPAKALGFPHGRIRPAQDHRRRTPVFHVSADTPRCACDMLNDVCACERPPQFRREVMVMFH